MTQVRNRFDKYQTPSVQSWRTTVFDYKEQIEACSSVHCGWGRVVFANTFGDQKKLLADLKKEAPGERDLAFYVKDPHIITSLSPTEVFLDPSHTFRIWFENYRSPKRQKNKNILIRRIRSLKDINAVNNLLISRGMVPLNPQKVQQQKSSKKTLFVIAEHLKTKEIIGFTNGIDHYEVFCDPEKGTSLWSLVVDPQTTIPGVGEALVRYLIEYYIAKGSSYLDLSVLHENQSAINLYQKLNFQRVPVYTLKRRNVINEKLYTAPARQTKLNPYGQIIVDEALRRGINVKVLDQESNMFKLTWGGRSITCRESLSDLTSAIAMTRCEDKRLCSRLLRTQGISVPDQFVVNDSPQELSAFVKKHKKLVVKPSCGEQGLGVKVNLTSLTQVRSALKELQSLGQQLIVEEMVEGLDVRVIVIDYQYVAAAVRRPPEITGDGHSTIKTLIQKLSRRRQAATQGESRVDIDDEVKKVLQTRKLQLEDVLPDGQVLRILNVANLHRGATITDITDKLPHYFAQVAQKSAQILEIPVVGFDFIIPKLDQKKYWILEANERPGLANHEPAPTAEKFMDFLFPQSQSTIIHPQTHHSAKKSESHR